VHFCPIDSVSAMCEHVWTRAYVPRREIVCVCCCECSALSFFVFVRAVGLAPPVCVVLSGGSPAVWRGGIGNHGQVQVCCKFWFLISGAGLRQFYRYFYASFIEIS
jgi:hypothetical protein